MAYHLFFAHALYDIVQILPSAFCTHKKMDALIELSKQSVVWKKLLGDTMEVYMPICDDTHFVCTPQTIECLQQTHALLGQNDTIPLFSQIDECKEEVGKLDHTFHTLFAVSKQASALLPQTQEILQDLKTKKYTAERYCRLPLSILEFFCLECEMYAGVLKKLKEGAQHCFFVPKDPIETHIQYLIASIDKKYDFDNIVHSFGKVAIDIKKERSYDAYFEMIPIFCGSVLKRKISTLALPLEFDHFFRYAYATKVTVFDK